MVGVNKYLTKSTNTKNRKDGDDSLNIIPYLFTTSPL